MACKVIDLHCDSVSSLMAGKDMLKNIPGAHVDLPRLKKGCVGLQVFAAYVPSGTVNAFDYAVQRLDAIAAFAGSSEDLAFVETFADANAVMAAGKTGIMAAVENGLAIEGSLEKLEQLRRRKVRILTLVHSRHLPWITSCSDNDPLRPENLSLDSFGGRVLDVMNDLGIIPDVSHSSQAAFWAVIRRSKKPVIASHSCAYSICRAARNLKDDQLKALGDSGGLAAVNFFCSFLSEPFRLAYEKNKTVPGNLPVPWTLIADHIDHMVKMAGINSVALGSDFDGIPAAPDGVTGSDFYPVLETELKNRGYSQESLDKIFNANFLRLLEQWD